MSVICGIIDLYSCTCQTDLLLPMVRAMTLCGRVHSRAYIKGGIALCQGGEDCKNLPLTISRNNRNYTLLFNGRLENTSALALSLSLSQSADVAEIILECYIAHGTSCFSMLEGEFVIIIYDEYTKELWLVRDRPGAMPLFYLIDESRLIFASEINGLLSAISRMGGAELYREISELPPKGIAVLSRLGLQCALRQETKQL